MRILLVGNYLPDRQESMQRFAGMLASGLIEQGHDVRIVQPFVISGNLVADHSSLKKWLGYIDKLVLFPRQLRKITKWADIVHVVDHSNSMYSAAIRSKPVIVTCHDLMAVRSALGEFPENITGRTGRIYQWLIRRGLKKSPLVVCVSQATRDDVVRLIGKKSDDIPVVYNGLNYPYSPMTSDSINEHVKTLGLDRDQEYLLHIGGNQWYKNRMGVLLLYLELLNLPGKSHLNLILVGQAWTDEIRSYVHEHKLGSRVIELTSVSNEQLRALYSISKGLLFPSLCEGFGWPIIEAQACGCPVFTTDMKPMTEVGGSAAIYIDPNEPLQAAKRISTALINNEGGGSVAIENTERFSKKTMIDSYIKIYKELVNNKKFSNL